MKLLSFTVANHKSLRDRTEFDLTRPGFPGLQPPEGRPWDEYVYPVAGVFGPNATGKTALLDAIAFVREAVDESAAGWTRLPSMPRAPFKLDRAAMAAPSEYELTFVAPDAGGRPVRYEYAFAVSDRGVERERLVEMPGRRRQTVFDRDASRPEAVKTRRGVPAATSLRAIAPRELVLSRALVLDHPTLAPVARALVEGLDVVRLGDDHRGERLRSIVESLLAGDADLADLVVLLQVADIGIRSIDVRDEEAPPAVRRFLQAVRALATADDPGEGEGGGDDVSEAVMQTLDFHHRGADPAAPPLRIDEESSGTLAWLALIAPAIDALRRGRVLFVDEIDASLHSSLVEVYLGMFADPDINVGGGQLVFTSHDTHLLAPTSATPLDPDQVWFTTKDGAGATDLYCLADFPRDKDANVAKRYLAGRYGALPYLAPSLLHRVIHRDDARGELTAAGER